MNKKIFAVAAMMLLIPMMAGAQALKGSYFLDNSLNRNKLNPAFAPNTGYWQLPVVGNLNLGLLSNMQIQDFIYPVNGQLYTFLNKNVTIDEFESNLARRPHLDVSADLNVINFGFFTGKSFWSFDMGLRINADIDIPRDLFTFMKKGTGTSASAQVHEIGALKANVAATAYASLGWSRDFSEYVPGLRLGARARALIPAAYVGLDLNNVSLETSPDKVKLNADGRLHAAMKGLSLAGQDGSISPSFDVTSLGLAGFGFSFDLGAEYNLAFDGFINGVKFSAAVTDLGMINYNADAVTGYTTKGDMEWTGMNISLSNPDAMNGVMDDLQKDLENLINLKEDKSSASLTRSSLPSFYVGAEMPFLKNKMSIGALYSARKSYHYTRHEMTVSYNLKPCRWFDMGVNYSFLNATKTIGTILELTPKAGPSLYLGFDYLFFELAKSPDIVPIPILPMSMRFNLHFGIAFTLGGKAKAKAE